MGFRSSQDSNRNSPDEESEKGERNALSRRKMLLATGVTTAGLAGCSSDQGGGTTPAETESTDNFGNRTLGSGEDTTATSDTTGSEETETETATGEPVDPQIDWYTARIPNRVSWNPWHKQSYSQINRWFYDPLNKIYYTGELASVMMDSWSWNNDKRAATVNLNDWYWWNGDQVTAEDNRVDRMMGIAMNPETSSLENVETVDDTTFRMIYKDPKNPRILERSALEGGPRFPADVLQPWVTKFQEATSQKERDELTKKLGQWEVTPQDAIENGYGTSMWKLESLGTTEFMAKKFEKHPYADRTNLTHHRWLLCKADSCDQYRVNNKFDYGNDGAFIEENPRAPEDLEILDKYPGLNQPCVHTNWSRKPHLKRRGVRRAMAYVIDNEKVATNTGGQGVEVQTGLPKLLHEEWLGDQKSNYIDYGLNSKPEKAKAELEKEGYTKDGQYWVDEEGSRISLDMMVVSWFNKGGRTIANQLNNFGFDITYEQPGSGTYWSRLDQGDYDLTFNSHFSQYPHPFMYLNYAYVFGIRVGGTPAEVRQWLDQGETHSPENGKPLIIELPTEIGAEDLSGETEKINHYELVEQIKTSQSFEKSQKAVKKLSWYWNFSLPQVDSYQGMDIVYGDTAHFNWPEKGSDIYKGYRNILHVVKTGNATGKTK